MKILKRGDLADEYEQPLQHFLAMFPLEDECSYCKTTFEMTVEDIFGTGLGNGDYIYYCPVCKNELYHMFIHEWQRKGWNIYLGKE